jgi:hypothetical protein
MQNYAKNLLLTAIIALLLIWSPAKAQNENVHFGIGVGGITTTTFPIKGQYKFKDIKTFMGFTGGGFFQYDFGKKIKTGNLKRWFFHGEVNASFRRLEAASFRETKSDTNYLSFKMKYANLAIPLGIGCRFNPSQDDYFSMSIGLFAVLDLPCYPRTVQELTIGTMDATQDINSVSCSGLLDVSFKYDFISLSLRYGFDALPVIDIRGDVERNEGAEKGVATGRKVQKIYTGNFMFSLNFIIF